MVQEAMAGRPLEMKEAFEEEIQNRITTKLEEKYVEMMEAKAKDEDEEEVEDEEDESEEDEDDEDDEDEDEKNESVDENFSNALRKAAVAHAKEISKKPEPKKTVAQKIKGFFSKNEAYSGADDTIGPEMKKLKDDGESKIQIIKAMKEKYGCSESKCNELYASYCS